MDQCVWLVFYDEDFGYLDSVVNRWYVPNFDIV